MRKNIINYKRFTAAMLAGVLLASAAYGTAFAAKPTTAGGPGTGKVTKTAELISQDSPGYWTMNDGIWYFYNPDGTPSSGWIVYKGKHYCVDSNGRMYFNAITPDGYFVDADGEWYQRKATILNQNFLAPEKFPSLQNSWSGVEQLKELRTVIRGVFEGRKLKISDSAIEYVVDTGKTENVLLGIYKITETGSYRLDIGISLDAGSVEMGEPETYDYAIFKAMLYQISSAPDHLEKAIYSSWEDSNSWNIGRYHWSWIGDSMIQYSAADGKGRYHIHPVNQE